MQSDNVPVFGKWRSLFWPIHRWELKKFLPLFLMFALIAFNYNLLRAYKDSMIVTASHSGAEVIPFIKVWGILPGAILLTYLFTRLTNHFSRERVFYIMMSLFLLFFFLFAFILFPAQEYLHPHALADKLQAHLPQGFKGLIAMFRHWTFTLFYIMSELWSTAILSVLFWGFANEVTTVPEARRYYGLLTTGANLSSIIAAQAVVFFNSGDLFLSWIPYGSNAWDQSILFLNCTIIATGLLTMAIFRWMNIRVIRPAESAKPSHMKTEKIKMSMRQNFAYLAKSKYLICISAIVVAYNLAINLTEVVWKNQIKQLYSTPNEFAVYFGEVMTLMAVVATLVGLFVTNSIIRRSWTATALIPALITLISGIAFFVFTLFQQFDIPWASAFFGTTPLMLSISFGSIQNSMTRACKYTLFDATKEMAFIPLSKESKLKGKSAIDGVGSRIGKSGGSVAHQGLLLICSTVAASTPYIACIFLIVICVWILAIFSLGKQFDALATQNGKLTIPDTPAQPKPVLMKEGA